MPASNRLLAARAGSMRVRHDYSMADMHALTVKAIYQAWWRRAATFTDRYELALTAIIERLYACEERPSADELVQAGKAAIRHSVEDEFRTHGIDVKDLWAEKPAALATMPKFCAFWWDHSAPTASPENRIIDSLALRQIWPRLHWRHRRILSALAEHGDYESAAASLGKPLTSFKTELWQARRQFLRFWHEGERPSRIWGRDSRIDTESRDRSVTAITIRRRAKKRAKKAQTERMTGGLYVQSDNES